MSGRKPIAQPSPGTWALGAALDQSQPLTKLLQRLQQSGQRFDAIREQLPDGLRAEVRPGPLDDTGWTLLVPGGAVASKLRQLLPQLQAALRAQGWPELAIRIRVQARGPAQPGSPSASPPVPPGSSRGSTSLNISKRFQAGSGGSTPGRGT